MIPDAVFVAAVALQTKFPLSRKISRNLGSMPKTYTDVLSTSRKHTTGFLVKNVGDCCGSTVLTGASCWPSSHCIPAQKFVSVAAVSITTVHRGCWTPTRRVLSTILFIVYIKISKLRPVDCLRPAKPFHPPAKHILPIMKK